MKSRPLAWYNEWDKAKAATLRNLIEEGAIAPGVVDERSIVEVQPEDLAGFTQCHFFAGGGLWSLCARNAGWTDDRPLWTGSCPCGPFSKAGLRKGFDDPRHLWPQWFRLISVCRPDVLFGEQSDEADAWLDLVSSDLESHGYAIGSAVIPAAGFRGYHGRHRIGFVADVDNTEWWSERAPWHDGRWPKTGRVQGDRHTRDGGADGRMAYTGRVGDERGIGRGDAHGPPGAAEGASPQRQRRGSDAGDCSPARRVGDAAERGSQGGAWERGEGGRFFQRIPAGPGGADWLFGRDGLWRPVEPGTCPLADESPARLGRLRLYGDAIDVGAFTNLIGAYLDSAPMVPA